jgi:hypothetical protein
MTIKPPIERFGLGTSTRGPGECRGAAGLGTYAAADIVMGSIWAGPGAPEQLLETCYGLLATIDFPKREDDSRP